MIWLWLFLAVLRTPVLAGELTISPPFAEVFLGEKDKSKTVEIEVGNLTEANLTFLLEAVDFGSLDESGGVAFLTSEAAGENKYGLASWISFENDKLLMNSGEKKKVRVTFLNREDMAPGGHYGAVLIRVVADEGSTNKQINLNQSYASLFYLEKTAGSRPGLKLLTVTTEKRKFGFPGMVFLRFENNGNIHLVPRGRVSVVTGGGKEVAFGIINPASGLIIPESFRKFLVEVKRNSFFIWPGRYRILTAYRYDGRENFDNFESNFFYFGWEGALIITLFLIVMTIGVKIWLKER